MAQWQNPKKPNDPYFDDGLTAQPGEPGFVGKPGWNYVGTPNWVSPIAEAPVEEPSPQPDLPLEG